MDKKDTYFYEEVLGKSTEKGEVREPEPAWEPFPGKKQGEYTLEDYYALPEDVRAELIDGVLYDMAAPSALHQDFMVGILHQMTDYIMKNGGPCKVYVSPIGVQLDCDDRTMVEPDLLILCDKEKRKERCIFGAPDFVLEILSPGTAYKDSHVKLKKYEAAGVKEYWMLDPPKKRLLVYRFGEEMDLSIYGLTGKVPVGIYQGKLEIDLDAVVRWAEL